MNILQNELGTVKNQQKEEEQECPQCPQTKLCIWQDDQFQQFQVDYLNQVFPQKLNKKSLSKGCQFIFHFLSSSLYYWIQLKQQQPIQQDKLSIKDYKLIEQLLKESNIINDIAFNRWGQFFNKKNEFQLRISQQCKFKVPSGVKIHQYQRNNSKFEIVRYTGDNKQLAQYKKRFEVLFLLYIDGVSYVWQQIDQWVYFIVYRVQQNRHHFVGVLSKFQFRISSLKQRHRISQVLILPKYQNNGHGKQLMDIVYKQSLDCKQCFQITTEAPSFEFQCLRDYKESEMMVKLKIFNIDKLEKIQDRQTINKNRQQLLSKENIRQIKQTLKLPGHQIERIVNLIMYYYILQNDTQQARAIYEQQLRQRIIINRSAFKSRKKLPHITFNGQNHQIKNFLIQKNKQQFLRNRDQVQQILTQTLEGYRRTINKLKKTKLIP